MSPLEINIILHIYAGARDYENQSTAYETATSMFLSEKLITIAPEEEDRTWRLTERGLSYIEYLLSVPLPVATWVTPTEGQ